MPPEETLMPKGARGFLGSVVPFLYGRYPLHIKPMHVVNGFLRAALDIPDASKIGSKVQQLVRPHPKYQRPSFLSIDPILNNPVQNKRFIRSMDWIVNRDSQAVPSGTHGSIFPLSAVMFTDKNSSDEQFGQMIWNLVSKNRPKIHKELVELYSPDDDDAMKLLGAVLSANEVPLMPKSKATEDIWGSTLGKKFAKKLVNWLEPAFDGLTMHTHSTRVTAFVRALHLIGFFASIRSPELAVRTDAKKWTELSPLMFYGGKLPGNKNERVMRLAVRSFDCVAQAQRNALREMFERQFKRRRGFRNLKGAALITAVFEGGDQKLPRAAKERAVSLSRSCDRTKLATVLCEEVYPVGEWERGVHGVGRTIGAAGPELRRSRGGYRFVLETPVLSLLVQATVPGGHDKEEGLLFDEWIDKVFDDFGIVLGKGRSQRLVGLLTRFETEELLVDLLATNQEELRQRMLRAGLAVEFSDGETVVMPDATHQRQRQTVNGD